MGVGLCDLGGSQKHKEFHMNFSDWKLSAEVLRTPWTSADTIAISAIPRITKVR